MQYKTPFLALLLGLATVVGSAGLAEARPGGHGGYGGYHGGGYHNGYGSQVTPEAQKMMENAYNAAAPKIMELRAKQAELTAKIYGGADQKTIDALTQEVGRLQAEVMAERVKTQQQFAKAGIPIQHGGACGFGSGMRGMRGHGYHVPPAPPAAPAQ